MRVPTITFLGAFLLSGATVAEEPAPVRALDFEGFLGRVRVHNPDLVAQRMEEKIRAAAVETAGRRPDPQVTVSLDSLQVPQPHAPTVASVRLSQTFELGGKRSSRIAAAEAERKAIRADIFKGEAETLHAAADAWVDALAARLTLQYKQATLKNLEQLCAVNQERLRLGDIGRIEYAESEVEARRFGGEVAGVAGEARATTIELLRLAGLPMGDGEIELQGGLEPQGPEPQAANLLAAAKAQNPRLKALRAAVESARSREALASSERWIDLDLGMGYIRSMPGTGDFKQRAFDAITASVGIPIPLSLANRGPVREAQAAREKAERELEAAIAGVEAAIGQALARCAAARERVALFGGNVLVQVQEVRDARLFSYRHGDSTLLEELNAERTLDDLRLQHVDVLREHAHALLAVRQLAGQQPSLSERAGR